MYLLGVAGFLGSIFCMILLGRSHDFSLDWQEVYTSRRDILNIMLFINIPSLLLILLTDVILLTRTGFANRQVRLKMALNVLVAFLTIGVIFTASFAMVEHAGKALQLSMGSHDTFIKIHLAKDIVGPINLLIFLISTAIGIRLREKPIQHS